MGRRLACLALVVAVACSPCEREPDSASAEPLPPPRRAAPIAPRPLAAPNAFDLVATAYGAVLVWGPPRQGGAGLVTAALDRSGAPRAPDRDVLRATRAERERTASDPLGEAIEVAGAAGGGRMGLVWVEHGGGGLSRILATHGDDRAEAFAPPRELRVSESARNPGRGSIAAAVSTSGTIDLLYRGRKGACGGTRQRTGCAQFFHWQPGGARRGIPLVVPKPCNKALVGSLFRGGRWYFALCAETNDHPTTTLYAIQYEPEYAHAEELHEGCEPQGLGPSPEGVVLFSRCEGSIHATQVALAGKRRVHLGPVVRRAACVDGRPVLSLRGSDGERLELALAAPVGGIEGWLPEGWAPEGTRAAWTGETLLVAVSLGKEVAVRRYECEDGRMTRTDVPW